MGRERDYNIEMLRVVSCVLVICIHVSNVYSRAYGEISDVSYLISLITNAFARVSVPLFFMISGYLLLKEPISLRKCIRRVLFMVTVLVIWSAVYYVWKLFYWGESYDFRLIFDEPVEKHLWFLYAILGMYISLPFFQCLFQKQSGRLMEYFIVLWLFFLTLNYILVLLDMDFSYPIPLVGSSCYLGYFVMGYILRCQSGQYGLSPRLCFALSIMAAMATVSITFLSSKQSGEHVEVYFQYRNVMIALSSLLLFYGVMQNKSRRFTARCKSFMRLVSRHSFTVYLSHILFLDMVKKNCNLLVISSWIGILLLTAGIFAASLLFSVVLDYCSASVKKKMSGMLCYFAKLVQKKCA